MRDEHVELFERALVQQQLDPFPRRQLPLGMMGRDPVLPAAGNRFGPAFREFIENV